MVVLVVTAALACTPAAPSVAELPQLPAYTFGPTGIHGGGFQNVVAADPRGPILVGGDVSGVSRSVDGGSTWAGSNLGVWEIGMRAVASLVVSPSDPHTIYAGTGYQGRRGGFLVSQDGGATWTARSKVPQFSGVSNPGVGLPNPHPRSTGTLIAEDPARSLVYAATFDDGVMRSADGGWSWTTIGLAGTHLRSMVLDPSEPDTLLIATHGQGLWRASEASGAAVFERMAAAPSVVEELVVVGTEVYAAAGPNGIHRVEDRGAAWTKLGTGSLPETGPNWSAIAGVVGCDGPVLYAGSATGGVWSVARSADGGATWSSLSSMTVSTTIGGPGGEPWWLAAKRAHMMLGGVNYVAGQLAVTPPDQLCGPERVVLTGRSGIWSSEGGSAWYPSVRHLGTTMTHGVAVDPLTPARAATGVGDWGHLFSTNAADRVTMAAPTGVTDAHDVAYDTSTTPPTLLLGVGHPTKNKGEVFSSTDPLSVAWKDEGLSGPTGGKRVLGVAAGTNTAGKRVLVAAVDGGGVWRKVGSNTWKKAAGGAVSTVQKTNRVSVAWPAGTSTIYLYDRQSGVWRSNDAGSSFVRIWTRTSPYDMSGFVAAADGDPATLFVSVGNTGVFRIDGATSGTVGAGLTPVPLNLTTNPGPIAVTGSRFVATRIAGGGLPAQIFLSQDDGVTWTPVGDDLYSSWALNPRDVAVAADGTIYVALNGAGLLKGTAGT